MKNIIKLYEAASYDKYKDKISKEDFDAYLSIDPNKSVWTINSFIKIPPKERKEYFDTHKDEIRKNLKKWYLLTKTDKHIKAGILKSKDISVQLKGIPGNNDFEKLKEFLSSLKKPLSFNVPDTVDGEFREVYHDDSWVLAQVLTHEASVFFGRHECDGSTCVSMDDEYGLDMFRRYTKNADLYYLRQLPFNNVGLTLKIDKDNPSENEFADLQNIHSALNESPLWGIAEGSKFFNKDILETLPLKLIEILSELEGGGLSSFIESLVALLEEKDVIEVLNSIIENSSKIPLKEHDDWIEALQNVSKNVSFLNEYLSSFITKLHDALEDEDKKELSNILLFEDIIFYLKAHTNVTELPFDIPDNLLQSFIIFINSYNTQKDKDALIKFLYLSFKQHKGNIEELLKSVYKKEILDYLVYSTHIASNTDTPLSLEQEKEFLPLIINFISKTFSAEGIYHYPYFSEILKQVYIYKAPYKSILSIIPLGSLDSKAKINNLEEFLKSFITSEEEHLEVYDFMGLFKKEYADYLTLFLLDFFGWDSFMYQQKKRALSYIVEKGFITGNNAKVQSMLMRDFSEQSFLLEFLFSNGYFFNMDTSSFFGNFLAGISLNIEKNTSFSNDKQKDAFISLLQQISEFPNNLITSSFDFLAHTYKNQETQEVIVKNAQPKLKNGFIKAAVFRIFPDREKVSFYSKGIQEIYDHRVLENASFLHLKELCGIKELDDFKQYGIIFVLKEPIKEMAYPVSFNMEEFLKIPSYSKKIQYADSKLERLSNAGSSRTVYRIDDEKVLKVAKNNKGLAQNIAESDWALQETYPDMIAQVFESDEDGYFLEMEKALSIGPKKFESLMSFTHNDLRLYLFYYDTPKKFHIDPALKGALDENEWVQRLIELAVNFDYVLPGDFGRINSYGLVTRKGKERVILTDLGLTRSVYNDYYY